MNEKQSAEVVTASAAHAKPRGSIACVGLGMTLGSHLGPLARSHIEQADVVFAALSDGIVEVWLQGMHPDVRSLQPYYGNGDKSRAVTYRVWVVIFARGPRWVHGVCLGSDDEQARPGRGGVLMTNTIEMLEAIGRDASLRHASGPDLFQALEGMGASEGLMAAAVSGDCGSLKQELGGRANLVTQVNQNPVDGGCDIFEDDDFQDADPGLDDDVNVDPND